jgi:hypothetical protein
MSDPLDELMTELRRIRTTLVLCAGFLRDLDAAQAAHDKDKAARASALLHAYLLSQEAGERDSLDLVARQQAEIQQLLDEKQRQRALIEGLKAKLAAAGL